MQLKARVHVSVLCQWRLLVCLYCSLYKQSEPYLSLDNCISYNFSVYLCVFLYVFYLPIKTYSTCRTHRLCLFFFSSSPPPACRSISAVLLRVTAAMAGAICGQTLSIAVKAQTISCSAGPLSFSLPLIVLH